MADATDATSNYLRWAQLLYGMYQDQRKPRYDTAPMSPQQKEMYDLYIQGLKNPATANNAGIVSSYAQQALQHQPTWNSPKTFSGDVGYQGNPGFQFKMPNFSAPTYPGAGPTGGGGSGQPSGGIGASVPGVPGAGGSDPFYGMPSGNGSSGNTSWEQVRGFASQYGKPAMEFVASLLGGNPMMGAKAVYDALRARFSGTANGTATPGQSPNNGAPINPAGDPWQMMMDEIQKRYRDEQSQRNADKTQGAQGISYWLGLQQSGGLDHGRKRSF